jgi:hypothetical protein|eukprot:3203979-Prymnesium_polylepis.1
MAVFVVGNVRDKNGMLQTMKTDTENAFKGVSWSVYNNFVLNTAKGTAPMRAEHTMRAASKNVPTHQDVIVFYKGTSYNTETAKRLCIIAHEGDAEAAEQLLRARSCS